MNTEDIRRLRKKAPCTRSEILLIQRQFLEDDIFNQPIFTGDFLVPSLIYIIGVLSFFVGAWFTTLMEFLFDMCFRYVSRLALVAL